MAETTLTYKEFWKLSEKERLERYEELSAHDKFLVRITMPIACKTPVCNECSHSKGVNCDAFPDGRPMPVLDVKIEQKGDQKALQSSCNGKDDIHFEPKSGD